MHFKIENTPIKDTNGKRKFKRMLSFFFSTNKSFLLWNCLWRNSTLFNQPRQRGFWRNLRYILYSMVNDSTFLKENFCIIFFPLCEVSQKSTWKSISLRYLGISKKGYKLFMHELKTGVYADKFATFWMFPERFYCFIRRWIFFKKFQCCN